MIKNTNTRYVIDCDKLTHYDNIRKIYNYI